MSDLKPCPFCGGEARLCDAKSDLGWMPEQGRYLVQCDIYSKNKCLVRPETRFFLRKDDAIKAWNSRQEHE